MSHKAPRLYETFCHIVCKSFLLTSNFISFKIPNQNQSKSILISLDILCSLHDHKINNSTSSLLIQTLHHMINNSQAKFSKNSLLSCKILGHSLYKRALSPSPKNFDSIREASPCGHHASNLIYSSL